MDENQPESRWGSPILGPIIGIALILVCILAVLILLAPAIGPLVEFATSPCAIVFIDQNGDDLYTKGVDRDVTRQRDFTIKMTDDSGQVLYYDRAAGCRLPSDTSSVTLTLTTSAAYHAADPVLIVNPRGVCDSGCAWPHFVVTQVNP
jgi:hypothetical protein